MLQEIGLAQLSKRNSIWLPGPSRLARRRGQSFKTMEIDVSQCAYLFHTASSLRMSINHPWESCPFLSEDIALLTGSLSHPRYRFWFVTGLLCNCKMNQSPKTEAGQSYPAAIYRLSWKMPKELNQTRVLLPHVIRVYLVETPWRRSAHCQLTKTTNLNCCLIKRKVAQWINKRMAPQGQDMNHKRLWWMWGKWSMETVQLKSLWRELKRTVPVNATLRPRWL